MKNLTRKFLLAVLAVVFAAVSLGTTTFAWFSTNNKVEATGMSVKAYAEGNLVINKFKAVEQGATDTSVDFGSKTMDLKPMAWDKVDSTGTLGWGVPATPSEIQTNTGSYDAQLKEIDSTAFAETKYLADGTESIGYYADYMIYIASAGDKLENKNLWVKIELDDKARELYQSSMHIAFYYCGIAKGVNEVASSATVKDQKVVKSGALAENCFFDVDVKEHSNYAVSSSAESNGLLVNKQSKEMWVNLGKINEIPSNKDQAAGICIIMRVYFDGNDEFTSDLYNQVKDTDLELKDISKYYVLEKEGTKDEKLVKVTSKKYDPNAKYYTCEGDVPSSGTTGATFVADPRTNNVDISNYYTFTGKAYKTASGGVFAADTKYYTKSSGTAAYINSAHLPVNNFNISVTFQAADLKVDLKK